ncbi:HNH endonuclease [Botrimarina mediterranea]|uniref:HNH endonuclease n=2 Tax=Botrimarina mediterranea TaxID=2528022 RepID=A0A518K7M5_9BACT|nr:HNH endonuclease [Botrimarina mediterranea]
MTMSCETGRSVFAYPTDAHIRRHGPIGYTHYPSFKPWLRDEFSFRCVYCLLRERWYPNGPDSFGVDHVVPKSVELTLVCAYDNLVYACNRCNSAKLTAQVLDPCVDGLGNHLRIEDNGVATALTKEGEYAIDAFNLNDARLQKYRREVINKICRWEENDDHESLTWDLGYPSSLPRLDILRCKSNARPEGISESHFDRHSRGELPDRY